MEPGSLTAQHMLAHSQPPLRLLLRLCHAMSHVHGSGRVALSLSSSSLIHLIFRAPALGIAFSRSFWALLRVLSWVKS